MNNNLPSKPTARYRPKADRSALYRSIEDAWTAKQNEWAESDSRSLISSAATELLESLFPVEDMLVLQKYGKAEAETTVAIRVYNYRSKYWDVVYRAELEHPVIVTNYAELSALRPQYWNDPLLGVSSERKEKMTEEEWGEVVAHNEKARAIQMPTELDSVFTNWLDMVHGYQQDLKIGDWITEKKSAEGIYPTWGEIVAHCPVLLRIEEIKNWEEESKFTLTP